MITKNFCTCKTRLNVDDEPVYVYVNYHRFVDNSVSFYIEISNRHKNPTWTLDFRFDNYVSEVPSIQALRKIFLKRSKKLNLGERKQLLQNEKFPAMVHVYLLDVFEKMKIDVKHFGL